MENTRGILRELNDDSKMAPFDINFPVNMKENVA